MEQADKDPLMPRPPSTHPTDGELEILQVLWRSGPASLGEIHNELREERPLAKTTVATMLKLMLQKKLLRRQEGPRGYLWSAAVSHQQTATEMLGKLIAGIFEGSAQRMVAHLVETGHITEKELEVMACLVKSQRKTGSQDQEK
jgi:predicted transcriptional regulator